MPQEEVPALWKTLGKQFYGRIAMGVMHQPTEAILEQVQVKELPAIVTLFSANGSQEALQMAPFMGRMNHHELAQYLNILAKPLEKPESAPKPMASQPLMEITATRGVDAVCGSAGLCVVGHPRRA